jgi:hypothetical protein
MDVSLCTMHCSRKSRVSSHAPSIGPRTRIVTPAALAAVLGVVRGVLMTFSAACVQVPGVLLEPGRRIRVAVC